MRTYHIRISNSVTVDVEKHGANSQRLGQPSGVLEYKGKIRDRIRALQQEAIDHELTADKIGELGKRLFRALFDDVLARDLLLFLSDADEQHEDVRLVLDVDELHLPELAALPWELLCMPPEAGMLWFGTAPHLTLVRWSRHWSPPTPIELRPGEPLRIALAVATVNPSSELGEVSYRRIWEGLQGLTNESDLIRLLPLVEPATSQSIDDVLRSEPHLFHFIGHGRTQDDAGRKVGQIALVDSISGGPDWKSASDFSELFNRHRPAVVFLQACEGAARSTTDALAGVAAHLLRQGAKGIPVVVAMQYRVSNVTASSFAQTFYKQLAGGAMVDQAVQEARRKIALGAAGYQRLDFATPVLFMRTHDGRLFHRPDRAEAQNQNLRVLRTRLSQLTLLLGEIDWSQPLLIHTYRAVLPSRTWWNPGNASAGVTGALWRMLETLIDAPANVDGVPPVLNFVRRLATDSAGMRIQAQLMSWIRETASELGIPMSWMDADFDNSVPGAQLDGLYLLVKISAMHHDQFRVEAWIVRGRPEDADPVPLERDVITLERAETVLNELCEAIRDDLILAENHLTIEFLLPRELLCWEVDHLRVRTGKVLRPLVRKYQVCVRSYDRLYDPDMRSTWPLWKAKWSHCEVASGDSIVWVCSTADAAEERLLNELDSDGKICVGLTIVPPRAPREDDEQDVLWTVLNAGIPIALWPRHTRDKEMEALRFRLDSGGLKDIPTVVTEHRRSVGEFDKDGDLGRHLTLLWDNPDRVPPDVSTHGLFRFRGPAKVRRPT